MTRKKKTKQDSAYSIVTTIFQSWLIVILAVCAGLVIYVSAGSIGNMGLSASQLIKDSAYTSCKFSEDCQKQIEPYEKFCTQKNGKFELQGYNGTPICLIDNEYLGFQIIDGELHLTGGKIK